MKNNRPRRRPRRRRIAAALLLGLAAAVFAASGPHRARAAESAVIVMYHRFGEHDAAATNITLQQFAAHIAELTSGRYSVLPLPEIVAALREGRPLPDRTVAITIDDAYLSVYREAWPMLKAAGLPFTLFVATDPLDAGLPDYMSWSQLREMKQAGVTIGHHTASHRHMATAPTARNEAELADAEARFRAELGETPTLFAYPYGEASAAVQDLVRRHGFAAAFGQHSGVAHGGSNFFYLPRFALNETYGDPERFRLVINALPLPVREITPADPLIRDNPPAFGMTVDSALGGLDRLACYHSAFGKVAVERLGAHRIELRFDGPFPTGRSRLNCTMPGPDDRWRWFGTQFYVPAARSAG